MSFGKPLFLTTTPLPTTGNTLRALDPTTDLETIVDGGDINRSWELSNANVIDAYFVQRAPGFGSVGDNTANGLAFVDSSGTAIHVGDNLLGFQSGLEVIAVSSHTNWVTT